MCDNRVCPAQRHFESMLISDNVVLLQQVSGLSLKAGHLAGRPECFASPNFSRTRAAEGNRFEANTSAADETILGIAVQMHGSAAFTRS